MDMREILFVCEHNSARSQIAEAYLNHYAAGRLHAESAGLEPGSLNPSVVAVLAEEGLDISGNESKSVFELYRRQKRYDAVIAVCSPAVSGKCPIFPGRVLRLNWPFDDPAQLNGSPEEVLDQTRAIRDQIRTKVLSFIREYEEKGLRLFLEQ